MDKGDSQPSPAKEKEQSPAKRLVALIGEVLWDIPFTRPVFAFFVEEGKAVKQGWAAFIVMASIVACVMHACEKDQRDKVERERDKYFQALQPWQALAASHFTNAPPDKRIDVLLTNVTAMLSGLNRLEASHERRRLTAEQKEVMARTLRSMPKEGVTIDYPIGNDEAGTFARDIRDALSAAGIASDMRSAHRDAGETPPGISLYGNLPTLVSAQRLQKAFKDIGFEALARACTSCPERHVFIVVGARE